MKSFLLRLSVYLVSAFGLSVILSGQTIPLGTIPASGGGGSGFGDDDHSTWNGRLLSTTSIETIPESFTATGTTSANATASITGVGTAFLTEIHVGDRIALSSAPSTLGTVVKVTSDTSLTLDSGWSLDALGDGTSQTITVYPASLRVSNSDGEPSLIVDYHGRWAFTSRDPVNGSGAGTVGVTSYDTLLWQHDILESGESFGFYQRLGATATFTTAFRSELIDQTAAPGATMYGIYSSPEGSETVKTGTIYATLSIPTARAGGATNIYSYEAGLGATGGGTTDLWYGFGALAPALFNGSTITTAYAFHSRNLIGSATNPYAFWYDGGAGSNCDSGGVTRINDLGIFAYYNPCFAKYVPAAANFERLIARWGDTGVFGTDNIAYIGVEAGGTGTARALELIGGGLRFNSTLVTPASSGTRYLCISTAGVVTSSASACSGT